MRTNTLVPVLCHFDNQVADIDQISQFTYLFGNQGSLVQVFCFLVNYFETFQASDENLTWALDLEAAVNGAIMCMAAHALAVAPTCRRTPR